MNYHLTSVLLFCAIQSYAQGPFKTYTVQEFLDASASELSAHKKNLDLQMQQKKLNIPQSQAMLFYPDPIKNQELLLNQLREWNALSRPSFFKIPFFKGSKLDRGIDKALNAAMKAEEKAHRHNNVVLYHSTSPDVYAKNYIDTMAKKLELEVKGHKTQSKMLLLRDPEKHQDYEKERIKRKHFLKEGAWDTWEGEHILACNVGLTGNISDPTRISKGENITDVGPGESTLKYFLKKLNINKPEKMSINPMVDDKLLDNQLKLVRPELEDTAKKFNDQTNTGILLQLILKDEKLAKKVLYNALPGGSRTDIRIRESLLHGEKVTDPIKILRAIKTEPHAFAIPQTERSHHFFQECLDTQQLRVTLTGDLLLDMNNPEVSKNFTVNAFSADENLERFKDDVNTIMHTVKHNYLAQKGQLTFFDRLKYRTINFFRRRPTPLEQKQRLKEFKKQIYFTGE